MNKHEISSGLLTSFLVVSVSILTLWSQDSFSKNPTKPKDQCGSGSGWMSEASAEAFCISWYKSTYSDLLEKNNYTFPGTRISRVHAESTSTITYVKGYKTLTEDGDEVGSSTYWSYQCRSGYQWDAESGTCQSGIQKGAGSPCSSGKPDTGVKNPCDAATGNKFQSEVDYESPYLDFIRYYNSYYVVNPDVGVQWTHNHSVRMIYNEDYTSLTVFRANGRAFSFIQDADSWKPDEDVTERLEKVDSGWRFTTEDNKKELFDANGLLQKIIDIQGNETSYFYDQENNLDRVVGPYNRILTFHYDEEGRIERLETPEGHSIYYEYDPTLNNLIKVTYPDNTPEDLTDNPSKEYHYEDEKHLTHLTGITDENGIRYASWTYHSDGKVKSSEHAAKTEWAELIYNSDGSTTVLDTLGNTKVYTFTNLYGVRKPTSITETYDDGSGAIITKTESYTYYLESGWIESHTDFEGIVTKYFYDENQIEKRGLETTRIEAFGTSEQRTTTTQWHPTFRLPTQVITPHAITTYSYDALTGQLLDTTVTEAVVP